jgi:hypothetical protein
MSRGADEGRFRVVVIAPSAGGLDALSRILSQLTPALKWK